jgi:hypothetical protein
VLVFSGVRDVAQIVGGRPKVGLNGEFAGFTVAKSIVASSIGFRRRYLTSPPGVL